MRVFYDGKHQQWVVEHKITVTVPLTQLKDLTKVEQKELLTRLETKLKQYCDGFGGSIDAA